jgi:hypothetical protein
MKTYAILVSALLALPAAAQVSGGGGGGGGFPPSGPATLTNMSIDATTNTITNISNSEVKAAAAIALNKLAATTASRAVVSDGSGFMSPATTTATEIGYVNGVTSSLCGINQSCTLTNKTISGSANTITNIQNSSLPADMIISSTIVSPEFDAPSSSAVALYDALVGASTSGSFIDTLVTRTAGDLFRFKNHGTTLAAVDYTGKGTFVGVLLTPSAIGTCNAGALNTLKPDTVSAGETSRTCFCEQDGATSNYFWRNVATGVRGSATVCPSTDAAIPVGSGTSRFWQSLCSHSAAWQIIGSQSVTSSGTLASSTETSGYWCKYTSSNANPSTSGSSFSFIGIPLNDVLFTVIYRTGPNAADIDSGTRTWVGFTDGSLSTTATPTAQNVAAFRYAPNAGTDGTAFWRTATCDAAACTYTTTTQSIAADTEYLMQARINTNEVLFYINHVLVAQHTTHLPGSTVAMNALVAYVTQLDANVARLSKQKFYSIIDRNSRP